MEITEREPGDLAKLTRLAKTTPKPRIANRCRIVIDAINGRETLSIAERRGCGRATVQRWCYAYRDHGIEALDDKPKSGRPRRLSAEDHERFRERVLAGPTDADGVCTLRGRDFQRILAEEFGRSLSLTGVYELLHRLGLSCLKPRPRHTDTDPEAQRAWTQSAPFLSTGSANSTPTAKSRSGSRTRPASASRGG